MISKIRKRDGRIVDFDPEKITNAIFKAAQAVGGRDRSIAEKLTNQVVELLEKQLKPGEIPTVEQVQDLVEKVLVENGHYKTAKAYILYRQKRAEARRIKAMLGVEDELKLPTNALLILAARYLRKDASGKIIESTGQMFRRVAKAIAEVERMYGKDEEYIKNLEEEFYRMMTNLEFLPNCLSTDTLIPTQNGLVELGNISKKTSEIKEKVAADKGTRDAVFFFSNGPKVAWKITTTYGFSITATPEHFFRVIDKNGEYVWKQLKNIGKEDYLAIQKDFIFTEQEPFLTTPEVKEKGRRPIIYPAQLVPELAEIVGYLLTDGYVRRATNTIELAVNSKDKDVAKRLCKDFKAVFGVNARIEKSKEKNSFLVSVFSPDLIKFLEENNLSKSSSSTQITVPQKILMGTRKSISAFLRAVFEAEGRVSKRSIKLYSTSLNFLSQVQLLLLGLGIVSKLEKRKDCYRLVINKDLNGELFVKRVNFLSKRKRELAKMFLEPKHHKDFIPNQSRRLKNWCKSLKKKNYKLYKKIARFLIETKYGKEVSRYIFKKYKKRFKELETCYLKELAELNQFYDKIKEIKIVETSTADLFVPGGNTYVANGFVTHNSPTLMNAGVPDGLNLSACFVIPIEDSIESIFEALKTMAIIQKSGGGTGFSFSRLRPKGDIVRSTSGIASGPISFMRVFNAATEEIKQGGRRRGANMGILRVDHPDILDFIVCKEQEGALRNFNISVAITDKFMDAVKNDKDFELINPRNKAVVKTLKARAIWNLIVTMAWKNGEPGVIFIDRINKHCNTTPKLGEIEATNPCGEQPLLPYESCNLGSINLSKMLKKVNGKYEIDWEKLRKTVRLAVRFLDNIIDANKYPIKKIEEMTKGNRKIGLGVMGFADMLILLRIPYNSEEALQVARSVMKFISEEARKTSVELGKEKSSFPNFEGSRWDELGYEAMRNATLTTIAPTGSISEIAGCSQGIEPLFAIGYIRNVAESLGTNLIVINPHFERIAIEEGFYDEKIMKEVLGSTSIQHIKEIPEEIRRIFVTASDISPEWHVRMQAAFQEFVDNSISKTINFPYHATPHDVEKAFMLAYDLGCLGITVYRQGSRQQEVLKPIREGISTCEVCELS
jgi:adenosylcobalamin-dependent ribonucleoside-diphosphate reductase